MSTKSALKAAKSAIDAKKWDEARDQANTVLEKDPQNYFAKLFLGRAYDGLGKFDDSATAYNDATTLKPDEVQAWLGLRTLYEKQGPAKVDENTKTGLKLGELYAAAEDAHKSQTAIDKLVDFARKHGTQLQYARALATQLPTSPVYSFLEGRVSHPSLIYTRIADIYEADEKQTISRLVGERKTRLGATTEGVTIQVKQEIYEKSELEDIYQQIIDWTTDDELRRTYEERLLQRVHDHMLVLPAGKKQQKREKVMKLAHDMVIIQHPFLLAWQIELEWRSGLDIEVH